MNRIYLTLILLLVFVKASTFAGAPPYQFVVNSSSCNGVSFSWTGGVPGTVRVWIAILSVEPIIIMPYETFSNPDVDGGSFTFDPPFADGTMFNVNSSLYDALGDINSNDGETIVSCSDGSDGDSDGDEPYHELCNDGRANKNLCEPIAIYPIETDDGTGITIWDTRRTGSRGQLVYLAAEELANLPDYNCELSTSGDDYLTVISFAEDDIVIIAGPDDENKTFIFYFEEFPGLPMTDTLFGDIELDLPDCFD